MKDFSLCIAIVLTLVLTLVGTVGAISVSVSPLYVAPDGTITVNVQDMPDGTECTMSWEVYVDETGPDFQWNIVGLAFPVNLDKADFRITNQNTVTNKFTLENDVPDWGDRELILEGNSVNGIWTGSFGVPQGDFINGSWPTIQNEGTMVAGKSSVLTLLQWHGTKMANPRIASQTSGGPDDYSLSFSFSGIESGEVKFTILANGVNIETDTVVIGSPDSPTGSILVRSNTMGAQIYLDGVSYGTTPAMFVIGNVPPGLRTMTLVKNGEVIVSKQVMVYANRITTVVANSGIGPQPTTVPRPGQSGALNIRSDPWGATIRIDGVYYGVTPKMISGVTAGDHTLTLSKSGYNDYTGTITVKARGVTPVFVRLTKGTSTVSSFGGIDVYSYGSSNPVGTIDPSDLAGMNRPVISNRLNGILYRPAL